MRQIVQAKSPPKPNAAYVKWTELVTQKLVESAAADSGLHIAVDRSVVLDLLPPGGLPCLTAGNLSILFADGADEELQSTLLKETDLASTVLVTPRKLAPGFLDVVNPQLVVFFAGSGVRDQPSADLLAAQSGVTWFRTDERGTVELVVGGEGTNLAKGLK